MKVEHLDPQLRSLVSNTVTLLGDLIRHSAGHEVFNSIERTRKRMTTLRGASLGLKEKVLEKTFKELSALSSADQFTVAHSFALMLELMNTCENAYRSYRISARGPQTAAHKPSAIIYVLTAHPTEARAPANVAIFSELEQALISALNTSFEAQRENIRSLLQLAWHVAITRQRKPRVEDEAEYIYSVTLSEPLFSTLLQVQKIAPLYLRSWVGGDKDGHPGVNEKTLVRSLTLSRAKILQAVNARLARARRDLRLVKREKLMVRLTRLGRSLAALKTVRPGDGQRLKKFRHEFAGFLEQYHREFGSLHPALYEIRQIAHIFPALAIPLEVRESSDVLMEAVKSKKPFAITKMIAALAAVSKGADPRWYVRGFIISMASRTEHIDAATFILKKYLGGLKVPVIPLFEERKAMQDSPGVVTTMLRHKDIRRALDEFWEGHFEIMLGYSDSSKEMGVIQSRLLISETARRLEKTCRRFGITPVFFHGSGGSVDRGGGSLSEQVAWLPASSFKTYKATIQGEMVERNFSTPQILRSTVEKLAAQLGAGPSSDFCATGRCLKALDSFAAKVSAEYQKRIGSPEFLEMVHRATPYRYLSALRIGSRPAKRGKILKVTALRAIPWVLCWTQTRVLFPTWWGIGTAWAAAPASEKRELRRAFKRDPLFGSFVKALGFTLAKVELSVWRLYLLQSGLGAPQAEKIYESFKREYEGALKFVRAMSGEKNLLWFRPWLGESIALRNPMIHPLNLIQIHMLKRGNPVMIRETVAGIANGMLTTG